MDLPYKGSYGLAIWIVICQHWEQNIQVFCLAVVHALLFKQHSQVQAPNMPDLVRERRLQVVWMSCFQLGLSFLVAVFPNITGHQSEFTSGFTGSAGEKHGAIRIKYWRMEKVVMGKGCALRGKRSLCWFVQAVSTCTTIIFFFSPQNFVRLYLFLES